MADAALKAKGVRVLPCAQLSILKPMAQREGTLGKAML